MDGRTVMTFNTELVSSTNLSYPYGHKSRTRNYCLSHSGAKPSLTVMRKCYFERGEDTSVRVMNEEEVNKCCRRAGLPPSLHWQVSGHILV